MCLYGEHSRFGKIDFCPTVMTERRGHPNLGGSALLRVQGDTLLNLGMNSMSHVRSQTEGICDRLLLQLKVSPGLSRKELRRLMGSKRRCAIRR